VTRPRAADDFATIRARMEELRRERAQASKTEAREAEDRSLDTNRLLIRHSSDSRWFNSPAPQSAPGVRSSS
jgi:hypothetical protein